MDSVQETLNHMITLFETRMEAFERRQALNSDASSADDESLSNDFAAFKNFVTISLRALQSQIQVLAKQVDMQETRGRCKLLLLHGVTEDAAEDTNAVVHNTLVRHLKVGNLATTAIVRSHRMGRSKSTDKPRTILFELQDRTIRNNIWASKGGFKGSRISITEFLTKSRYDVLLSARRQFGATKCWTRDGTIIVSLPDGSRHRVVCAEDLSKVVIAATLIKQAPSEVSAAAVAATSQRTKRATRQKK